MDGLDDFLEMFVKKPKCIGVGQHQPDDGLIASGFQGSQVNISAFIRGYLHDLQVAHGGRGRVGAMSRIRNQHLCAFCIAVCFVVSAHHQHTGKFSMGACGWLEGHGGKTGDFLKPFL